MKPISDLARFWRALACSLRIKSTAIPTEPSEEDAPFFDDDMVFDAADET
jgi:hypothetical protein